MIYNFDVRKPLDSDQIKAGLVDPGLTVGQSKHIYELLKVDPEVDSLREQAQWLFFTIKTYLDDLKSKDFHIMGDPFLMCCLHEIAEQYGFRMWGSVTKLEEVKTLGEWGVITTRYEHRFVKLRKFGK